MSAEILSIGSELVSGRIADTNAAYLSDQLLRLGYEVTRHTAVDDRCAEIAAAIREIAARAKLCIVTGGLGPTRDDETRQVFAELTGTGLKEDAETVRRIESVFAMRGMKPSESNYGQAQYPANGAVLRNPAGTAAGFKVAVDGCQFYCLPGVPHEMKTMFHESVEPALRAKSPGVRLVRSLHLYGIPESVIGEKLYDVMAEDHNPSVATQASSGIITVRLTARGESEEKARGLIMECERTVRARLEEGIFGADGQTLAEAVAALLARRGMTLAVAESCTGGGITAELTDVPGISQWLLEGVVTYSNESKQRRVGVKAETLAKFGAVSAETTKEMASGIRESSGADIGLSVTGIAGPAGGSDKKPVGLIYFGLAHGDGVLAEEARVPGARTVVKDRAVKRALNMLRLYLVERAGVNG